jgi:2,4-dienoyl-CoA reductase-like NADH-dependent reductase (Old Yellow Enzyme family)
MSMTITRNRLDNPTAYKLTRWVEEQDGKIGNATVAHLAKLASATLGTTVTTKNIAMARRNAGLPTLKGVRQTTLAAQNKNRMYRISRHVASLYDMLGVPVPADLAQLAKTKQPTL